MKKTFYWSLGGHIGLLLVVVLVSLITSCAKKPKTTPHVFTVHSPPAKPVQKVEQNNRVSQPTPTPPKKQQDKPKPKPIKETPKPVEKKPKTTPKKDPPKTVSWEQFARENNIQPQRQQPQRQPQRPQPQHDPFDDIRQELSMLMKNAPAEMQNSSQHDIEALHGYIGQLRNQLNLLWDQPTNLPPGEWVAHVEFSVSGTGRIANVRFVKRSGNKSFDQSLIHALNKFLQVNPPPDKRSHTFEIPFRMYVR